MHVAHLSLTDFRSYRSLELPLGPGPTVLVGPNGQGKTNLVEAVGYLATLGSHRVSTDAPLVFAGADRAILRAALRRDSRELLLELEITPGKANRARVNRGPVPRPREILGLLRSVQFAPEDLAVVKGDPAERRRFLDDLIVARAPRFAAVRSDYDRVLRQRNALLKSAGAARRGGTASGLGTLDAWDTHLAEHGAALLAARLELVALLAPEVANAYDAVSGAAGPIRLDYRSSVPGSGSEAGTGTDVGPCVGSTPDSGPDEEHLRTALLAAVQAARPQELERGMSLVGPHRDDLVLRIGEFPAKGYASHGESWSLALALRLASYELLRGVGGDPVLVLDDVFAELDPLRRARLGRLVSTAEQVLVTAAVADDVPAELDGARFSVADGAVTGVA